MTTRIEAAGQTDGHTAAAPPAPPRSTVKVILGGLLGTTVEYYDFAIYGLLATSLGATFFAKTDPNTALLATFATFAAAFIVRIPGGIVFGHIGDKIGRKRALTSTILLMTIATALIGILPGYITWGIWATVILVLCRCVQGFAAGGELGGANVFIAENAPWRHRGFQTSFAIIGTYLSSLLGSGVVLVISSTMSAESLNAWGWRIAFLLSVVLGLIGLYIRISVPESNQLAAVEESDEVSVEKLPLGAMFKSSWADILKLTAILSLVTGGFYMASVFSTSYMQTTGHQTPQIAFLSTTLAMTLGCIVVPISGVVGDRVGRRPVMISASIAALIVGFPCFMLMGSGNTGLAITGQLILVLTVATVAGSSVVTGVEVFPARVRYSGTAFSINLSNTLIGGTAPFIATLLMTLTHHNLAPAAFFCFTAVLSLIGTFWFHESKDKSTLPL